MKNIKFLFLFGLMLFSLNSVAQYNGDIREPHIVNISNINLIINNDHTLSITIPKVNDINVVRRVCIIGVLNDCNEYCLNLNNKSEIIINNNQFLATWMKSSGKYIIKVTIEEITPDGVKKTFFEEKYFDIM